jgi:protein gp37
MMNKRFGNSLPFDDSPVEFEIVWKQYRRPLSWRKPRTIFIESMGDLFHDAIPYEMVDQVMRMAINAPQHTYLILTKRIERALHYFTRGAYRLTDRKGCTMVGGFDKAGMLAIPDNVHVGVSVCTQDETWKIAKLLQIPVAKRFVSIEPMLGPIDIRPFLPYEIDSGGFDPQGYPIILGEREGVDQIIVGAETGPGARHMDLDWARSIRDQCQAAGVSFFFKKDSDGNHELDGRVWEEFPR